MTIFPLSVFSFGFFFFFFFWGAWVLKEINKVQQVQIIKKRKRKKDIMYLLCNLAFTLVGSTCCEKPATYNGHKIYLFVQIK